MSKSNFVGDAGAFDAEQSFAYQRLVHYSLCMAVRPTVWLTQALSIASNTRGVSSIICKKVHREHIYEPCCSTKPVGSSGIAITTSNLLKCNSSTTTASRSDRRFQHWFSGDSAENVRSHTIGPRWYRMPMSKRAHSRC